MIVKMKKLANYLSLMAIVAIFTFAACNKESKTDEQTAQTAAVDEFDLLLKHVEANGDYINSADVPNLIDATKVKELLGGNILIVDIRTAKDFAAGHIEGAVNAKLEELVDFAYENAFTDFEKVVMVCYSGQTASYGTAVLRLLGYDNVVAMKRGMSAWNPKTASNWNDNSSNKYASVLETNANPKNAAGKYPVIKTGKTDGAEILEARAREVLAAGFKGVSVKVDKLMEDPAAFYIVNYWPANLYIKGHIPGSVQYTPKQAFARTADLNTLPTDKPVLVYCFSGQTAAFVAAYLNILGYDAKSLSYGAASFMNTVMGQDEEIGHDWNKKQINNFKIIQSEYVETTETAQQSGGC